MTKCLRCGHPCESNGFSRSYDCTNPDCPFFGGRDVFDMMTEAEKMLQEAGL